MTDWLEEDLSIWIKKCEILIGQQRTGFVHHVGYVRQYVLYLVYVLSGGMKHICQ